MTQFMEHKVLFINLYFFLEYISLMHNISKQPNVILKKMFKTFDICYYMN
jgi:hypothetical protein